MAFVTTGGEDLAPNVWTEIVLTVIGAGCTATVLLMGARGRRHGSVTLALFAALVVLTALSVTWSVQPDTSWVEAGRTLAYFAVFGSAMALARLFPGRWPALIGAVTIAATTLCAFALLVKVFPATFDPGETFGRLRAPFDYWNATGLIAAMGLPPSLWAGARREHGRLSRALAVPAITVLLTVVILSYSRGALLAVVLGLAVWFWLVPLRLRGALVLTLGAFGAAILSVYAIETHALTRNLVVLSARTTAGHAFGVLIVLVLALGAVAGAAGAFAMDRLTLPEAQRRRIGTALIVVVALLPALGVGGLAASSRGLTGEVTHIWDALTSPNSGTNNGPSRLVKLGNSRGRYWREGIWVGDHALLKGAGALGYGTAITRYTHDSHTVGHAHSYAVETFADFGLIGVALMAAMMVSWSLAVRRTLGGSNALSSERAGLATLLAITVIFGVSSSVDWTWFIPGTAIPALLCAGWLAGRGVAGQAIGTRRRTRITTAPGTAAAIIVLVSATLICCWAVWQPLRSADSDAAALNAASSGRLGTAIADARRAADEYPVAVGPLFDLAAFYVATGDRPAAGAALQRATQRQPQNAQTWLQLADFELRTGHPRRALAPALKAQQLDLSSTTAAEDVTRAQTR